MKTAKRWQAPGRFPRTFAGVPTTGESVATTYRKATTVPPPREKRLASSIGSPKHRISNELASHGTSSVNRSCRLEIVVPRLAAVAKTVAALHSHSLGSTVSVTEGSLLGRSRFAVSIYPGKSAELASAPTRDLLFAFGVLNADLLLLPDHALGTWFDQARNQHVVDVIVCPQSLDSAIRLGIDHGQQAIFDLGKAREIPPVSIPEMRSVEVNCEES